MSLNRGLLSISCYLLLSLFVPFTTKKILSSETKNPAALPYLLTAIQAITCFVGLTIAARMLRRRRPSLTSYQHGWIVAFSLVHTTNMTLSKLSLSLVDLQTHETVRATAPVLTVVISVAFMGKPWRNYNFRVYAAIILILVGVMMALPQTPQGISDKAQEEENNGTLQVTATGVFVALLSTVAAVMNTMVTHSLTTSLRLNLNSMDLIQITSPYTAAQAFFTSYCFFKRGSGSSTNPATLSAKTEPAGLGGTSPNTTTILYAVDQQQQHRGNRIFLIMLWLVNAVATFMLNVATFEADRRNGPITMAVVPSLEQIASLVFPAVIGPIGGGGGSIPLRVLLSTIMTTVGGVWYAVESQRGRGGGEEVPESSDQIRLLSRSSRNDPV